MSIFWIVVTYFAIGLVLSVIIALIFSDDNKAVEMVIATVLVWPFVLVVFFFAFLGVTIVSFAEAIKESMSRKG